MPSLGDLLRYHRRQRGPSQEELADLVPPPPSPDTISKLERGRTRPHRHTLEALCQGLRLDDRARQAVWAVWRAAGPAGSPVSRAPAAAGLLLRVARGFLGAWFAIWRDDAGHRRSPAEGEQRYRAWRQDPAAAELARLRRQQRHLDADHSSRVQVELLDRQTWQTRLALASALFEYLEIFHNRQRRHSSLGMLTPVEFEARQTSNTAA